MAYLQVRTLFSFFFFFINHYISIGAVPLTDLQSPIQRRQIQGGLLLAVSHRWISQLLQQHCHHISVSVLGGAVKGRLPLMVLHRG